MGGGIYVHVGAKVCACVVMLVKVQEKKDSFLSLLLDTAFDTNQ